MIFVIYRSENPNMAPQTDLYAVPDKSKVNE